MKASVRESLKSGITFAAIGLVAALAVPPLLTSVAATMGLAAGGLLGAATIAGVLGTVLVFGGFGILYPRLKSLLGFGSGRQSPELTSETAAGKESDSRQIDINPQQAPEHPLQTDIGEPANTTFCQKVGAERIARKAGARLSI
jgi:hypothetical protein